MLRNALTVLLVVLVAGAGLLPFSTEPRADAGAIDGSHAPTALPAAPADDAVGPRADATPN